MEAEEGSIAAPMRIVKDEEAEDRPTMELFLHAADALKFHLEGYDGHPRIHALTKAKTPEFAALLVPLPHGTPSPQVTFQDQETSLQVQVKWPTHRDEITWPKTGERKPELRRE